MAFSTNLTCVLMSLRRPRLTSDFLSVCKIRFLADLILAMISNDINFDNESKTECYLRVASLYMGNFNASSLRSFHWNIYKKFYGLIGSGVIENFIRVFLFTIMERLMLKISLSREKIFFPTSLQPN